MNNYLNSQTHRFGCIFLICCCLIILLSSPQISWVYLLPFSYVIGCVFSIMATYIINFFRHFRKQKKVRVLPEKQLQLFDNDQSASHQLLNEMLNHLGNLEEKAKPHLRPSTRKLISEIDSIMKIMTRKLDESNADELSLEISDIQRTLSVYLTPALEYYCGLPKFLHHRQIPNSSYTPHELIELQLKTIQEEMLKISETIYENDLHQLIDHSQFLKLKLSNSEFFHIHSN